MKLKLYFVTHYISVDGTVNVYMQDCTYLEKISMSVAVNV